MNSFKILVFCLLLSSINGFAQYYNDYNGYGRFGGAAYDRNLGRNYTPAKEPTAEEIEKARSERVERTVAKLKEDLTLDDLQVVIIRNELLSNGKNVEIVMKKENNQEEKSKEVRALMDKTEVLIKSYLNKTQKEKYDLMVEEMKTNKKEKKDKKKDKEKEKATE